MLQGLSERWRVVPAACVHGGLHGQVWCLHEELRRIP